MRPQECLISKAVRRGADARVAAAVLRDLWKTRVDGNPILDAILAKLNPITARAGDKFVILVDESRYEVRVLSRSIRTVTLDQHFLHNTGHELIPVNYRRVVIRW